MNEANTRQAVRGVIANITGVYGGDCGWFDDVSAEGDYLGDTGTMAAVGYDSNNNSTCGQPNGTNTVAFGDRQPGALATTCTWAEAGPNPQSLHRTFETDIEIDQNGTPWTTFGDGADCSGSWDVENVMTHEWGHAFGLAHFLKARLTMSLSSPSCSITNRTLELGDVRGLRELY